jgi:hypothetical protein
MGYVNHQQPAPLALDDHLVSVSHSTPADEALLLLPAIYVAWADGSLGKAEREALRAYAEGHEAISEAAWELAQQWLETCPSEETIEDGIDRLISIAYDRSHPITEAMAQHAVDYAVVIEQTDDGGLDPFRVASRKEREAVGRVREIAATAHQIHGPEDGAVGWNPTTRWREVLEELDDENA